MLMIGRSAKLISYFPSPTLRRHEPKKTSYSYNRELSFDLKNRSEHGKTTMTT